MAGRAELLRASGIEDTRQNGMHVLNRCLCRSEHVWASLVPEVDEESAPVLGVLLDAVVERLDLLLVEETQYPLLELARPLARDDLHEGHLLGHGLIDDLA